MRNSLTDKRRDLPNQPVVRVQRVFMSAALTTLMLGGWALESQAETLRWKLNPGEVLRYTLEAKQVFNYKVMGRDKKSTRSHTINLSWTVKNVLGDGDAEIALRFDRVRMRIEQPPFMPLEFDSSPNKLEVPEEFESVERQIKALAGAEFTFKLRPTGEVEDLKVPEQTLKTLRDGISQEAAGQSMVSEKDLKAMLLQSSPPPFPSDSLEPGKTWKGKPSKISIPQLGSLAVDQVYTFQGPDAKNPKLMLVGMDARVTLEPAENVTAKIRMQDGKGSLTFDAEGGRIVNSRANQKMEMVISDRGQDIVQTTETNSTMTLEH
jgi:hypothetical protein